MTTKPLVGSQAQRQSQRSLNATNIISRPSPHRSLSSSSPTRRHNEGLIDLTLDVPEPISARYGPASRTGGSRLKQELSNDLKVSGQPEIPNLGSSSMISSRPTLPQRGRPQLHSDVLLMRSPNLGVIPDQPHNYISIKQMPLPVRPGQYSSPSTEKMNSTPTNPNKKDVRPKPYVIEVPATAPSYAPNGHADFFPWHGNHPEDHFSEPVIRQGFFDKTQMTQNETGSAKGSLSTSIKHKSSLQTLSSLFTSVLAQRRAHGNITANSTFKPPPRVTVTDTKREIWLKDLANPAISLRRLSRSIPHGIRGKVLLEHSLSKNIPIERAVWLAKCVGANELRSFKRKGAGGTFAMGGEAKWVRDFTVCVEQVLEGIIASCGDKDFRRRINYAIRLAAHFHAECLLDREHYMDWILSSLETSSQPKLPIWILITQLYWKDILRYRRFGRRLAAALLVRFSEAVQHPDRDILGPLIDRIRLLLKDLLVSGPDNFVLPEIWPKYGEVLRLNLACPDDSLFLTAWANIDRRNIRLTSPGPKIQQSLQQRLFRILDTLLSVLWTDEISDISWQLNDDKTALIHTILEWSTSFYRPGNAKVFIGARIIRSWSKLGANVTAAVLSFLDSSICEVGRNKPALYHLICELARSNNFCVPTYFQWLIGRGGINEQSELAATGPCATRLLAEVPINDLSCGMIGLRRTLLQRAEYSLEAEEQKVSSCINIVTGCLPGIPKTLDQEVPQTPEELESTRSLLRNMSRASKSEFGFWLRHRIEQQMLQPPIPALDNWDVHPMVRGPSMFSNAQFSLVREYLEVTNDFAVLADVIKSVTVSSDVQLLSSCADTLNLHIEIFAAIGALKGLFDILIGRLRSLADDVDTIPRVILVSLSDLSSRIPENHLISAQLAHQLALNDRKYAADACSPVSDHMAGVLHNNEAEFIDEIEKVLANGTTMDQGTMKRLFQKVTQHLSSSWNKSAEQQRKCVLLLTALRDFNPKAFDLLMLAWVTNIQNLAARPSMLRICGPLIGLGCLSIKDIANAYVKSTQSTQHMASKRMAMELLLLILRPLSIPGVLTLNETYRSRLFQVSMPNENPILMLSIIRNAFEACSGPSDGDLSSLTNATLNIFKETVLHELLQDLALSSAELTSKELVLPLVHSNNSTASDLVTRAINKLLDPACSAEAAQDLPIEAALRLANDLNLPFCQLKVASAFRAGDASKSVPPSTLHTNLNGLNGAIESMIVEGNMAWTCIIPSLDISVIQHLRRGVESQLLALFLLIKASNFHDVLQDEGQLARAENLLLILDLTIDSTSTDSATSTYNSYSCFPELVALLNSVWQFIAGTHENSSKAVFVSKWLPILLSFTGSQIAALEHSKPGHEYRGRTILVLTAILLDLHNLESSTEIRPLPMEQCFDLALHLVDRLPDDVRQQCIRSVREMTPNSTIAYIYSVIAIPTDWLYVDKGAGIGKTINTNPEVLQELSPQLSPFPLKRWEMLGEPTPNIGENDTSLSLTLFASRKSVT